MLLITILITLLKCSHSHTHTQTCTYTYTHTHTHTHTSSSSSVLLVLKDVGQDLGRHVTVVFQRLMDERSAPCAVLYHCLPVRQACQVLVDYIDPSQWCSSRGSTHSSWSALDDLTLRTMNRHSQYVSKPL